VTFDIAAGSPVEFAGGLLDLTNAVTFVDPSDYGTASFVKDGAGTLILSGSSSYSGTMRLNDGTVVLRDASGIGAGGLEIGTATLRLETDVNFGATLPIDVLAASDAVIEGDGRRPVGLSSTITGDALSTLTLRDLDVDFDGDAAGFLGELIVDDSGFTMDQETVGGSMTARNDSLLDATGQIAGDLTVQSSTLQLTGGVPAGPGTLDVLGNLSLDAGSVLRANVFLPLVGGAGTIRESDRINVLTGGSTAAMGGTLVALLNRDVSPGEVIPLRNQERSWRIIDAAGGGTGQFSAARLIVFDASSGIISDVDLPINSTLSTDIVEYRTTFDASGALITLFGLPTVPPDVVVDTACGTYTGTQINELIDLLLRTEALGNDDASAVAGAMLLYENVADIPPAYAATQQRSPYADPDVVIDSNVMAGRLAMLRLMQLRDGALGAAAANAADTRPGGGARPAPAQARDFRAPLNGPTPDDGERVWLRGYGFYETVDGDPCFGCGFDASIGAAMAGADWEIDGGGIIGGFVGGGAGSIQQDAIYGDQHTGITQGFAGIYGSLVPGKGDVYLQGFALGGYASLDRTRTIAIPDMVVTRNAESTNGAWTVSAGGEVGLNLELSRRTWLQPFAGVSWAQYWGGGYAETGAQSLDLTVQQQSAGELQPTAGARFMFASRSGRDVLSPFVGAAFLAQLPMGDGWAPVYTSDFNLGESMQFAGDPEDRYGGNIQVGLEFARFDGMTAFIAFDGAWLTGKQRYGGQIGVFVPF
jgi:outer membrane autotransporter protein